MMKGQENHPPPPAMTATTTRHLRYETIKQVERAIWRHRHLLGVHPILTANVADGNHGRLYHLTVSLQGPVAPRYAKYGTTIGCVDLFKNHPEAWCQGGIDRKTLLKWANETLPARPY